MLTQEDKQWIVEMLDERLNIERELMRDFIIDGRREDRAWVKEEMAELRISIERKVDIKIDSAIEKFAITVAKGFTEVHERLLQLEGQRAWK